MSFLKKPVAMDDAQAADILSSAGEWSSCFPALVEFLLVARWSDGTARIPGSLTLFTDQGQWKVCLSDKDSGRIAFVTSGSPQGALSAAEAGLVASSLDWRSSSRQGGQNRRK